jgi:hypothetical protein
VPDEYSSKSDQFERLGWFRLKPWFECLDWFGFNVMVRAVRGGLSLVGE